MSVLVVDLLNTHKAMDDKIKALTPLLLKHNGPRYLPTYQGSLCGETAAIVRSMCEIWHQDKGDEPLLLTGLVCVQADLLQAVVALNSAKDNFKYAVDRIRHGDKANATLTGLADHALKGLEPRRSEELRLAMQTAGISRLDLLKCYRHIRVLPSPLESLSWTWARTHTKSVPISMAEAEKKAVQLLSGDTLRLVLDKLGALKPGTAMTFMRELPPRLCANIVYRKDGLRSRKTITTTGVTVVEAPQLPKLAWRENPGPRQAEATDHLTRIDAKIDRTPYIKALNIHLYND
ncbi:hypothetical protein A9Q89_06940 [Gammaproteobacteria bacterium 53_120_T64]|nr:hypothetical protein A9Q89_06940 [Gammaproteobacteria bacterium 53_120_T64]